MPVDQASDSMIAQPKAIHFSYLGSELFVCCLVHRVSTGNLFCSRIPVVLFDRPGSLSVMQHVVSVEASSLLLHSIEA